MRHCSPPARVRLAGPALSTTLALFLAACGGSGGPESALLAQETASSRERAANIQGDPIYRFAKISSGAYFYTGSQAEAGYIRANLPDFRDEGIAFYQSDEASGVPVYRFANTTNGGYFYTASTWERDNTIANYPHMRYEGSTFSVAPASDSSASPVYRLANLQNGAYLYTTNSAERNAAIALGFWRDEGFTFSARTTSQGGSSGTPGDYLVTGQSIQVDGASQFHVVDPGTPATPRLTLNGTGTSFSPSARFQVQQNGLAGTYLGAPMAYYVQGSQVFQVSLKRSDATTPRRISALGTACDVTYQYALNAQGEDNWLEVEEAGPDGQCQSAGDNRKRFVRSGADTGTAPTALPAGISPLFQMDDENGQLGFILANDTRGATPRMVLLRPDLSVGPDVANSGAVQWSRGLYTMGHNSVRVVYGVSEGGVLQRMDWSANGAALGVPLHSFANAEDQRALATGNDAIYFVDGHSIYRTTGGAPTLLATVQATVGQLDVANVFLTPSMLVLRYTNLGALNSTILAVPRAGGLPITLLQTPTMDVMSYPLGVIGERLVYWKATPMVSDQSGDLRTVATNGQNDAPLAARATGAGAVFNRTQDRRQFTLTGVTWCQVPSGQPDCRQGQMRYVDLASGAITVLGSLNGSPTLTGFNALAPVNWADLPLTVHAFGFRTVGETTQSWADLWIARQSVTNSLARVTRLIP